MEAIAAALVLIFVLYLIDKHQRWSQAFKLVLGLAVLGAVGLGVTNSTFFAAPTATLNAPSTFGTATSTPDTNSPFVGTGGPRKIQLGLKFLF
jgi:hypothetical protein